MKSRARAFMSKCTAESNVDERSTIHLILGHELRLTATKVAEYVHFISVRFSVRLFSSTLCSLYSTDWCVHQFYNCHTYFIHTKQTVELFRAETLESTPFLALPWLLCNITWDWIYILFVLLLFGILCGLSVATHSEAISVHSVIYFGIAPFALLTAVCHYLTIRSFTDYRLQHTQTYAHIYGEREREIRRMSYKERLAKI